jgi:tartrate dehydrogenase/decarboxylase/D-malate dehydrogenase
VIPGDGIGKEVIPAGVKILDAVAASFDVRFDWEYFDWSCETYARCGQMMPSDGIEQLADFDAIYLGAVGHPGVPDQVSLWGLLIPIRREFDQYVNLRPCRTLPGIQSPLVGIEAGDIDYYIVRENTEGEYSSIGGRIYAGTDRETVVQQTVFTRRGVDRVLRYAFELAGARSGKLTSATKSNGIMHTMPYWDERFAEMAKEFPDVEVDQFHIDILAAHLVQRPTQFDVIVGSNLFGDILSDLGPATTGSIGVAPSANLNPEKEFPSMFEPVHGSAPDIAGRGIANPIGTIWAGAMMLDHLGHADAASAVVTGIETALTMHGPRTPDIGGNASTEEFGDAIADATMGAVARR